MHFTDEILNKIFSEFWKYQIPVGYQATAIDVIEKVFYKMKEENPYVNIFQLFESSTTDATELQRTDDAT